MTSTRTARALAITLLMALAGTGCSRATGESAPGPRIVQPGLPGSESTVVTAPSVRSGGTPHTAADTRFMQGMINHHAQAIVMSDLVAERTTNETIRMLALRIRISQVDEIALMQKWLRDRGESVPDPAHHMHSEHGLMAGMLTQEDLDRLAAARGADFDRLFLEYMIRHHEGAITMVAELFASPGAGQETDIFRVASEVDTDQRIEIARMRAMLNARN
ncbi:MAG TPA: DUF305 domain-containing protein [Longimicrobiales bacterium]|nr:DUF305 domain-containing protein [Longimicrobiales bacterium]